MSEWIPNTPDPKWAPAFWTQDDSIQWDYAEGDKAVALAEYAFANSPSPITLDRFQIWIIREALKKHPTGEFAYRQFIVSMARQQGKTTLASALMLYFLLAHHPQPNIFTIASTLQQARICYDRFSNLVNSNASLKKRFRPTTETRGIKTKAGGYLQVSTSKAASLQGHSLTACVLDELHLLKPETYDAVVIGAGQQHNSLIFGITTAGSEESTLLKRLYEQGKAGVDGLGIAIWEADENARVDDPEQLKKANPALAEGRMSLEKTLQEVATLPEADAVRYRLNRFITSENPFLSQGLWKQLEETTYPPNTMKIVADLSPGWNALTIAGSWKDGDIINTDILASVIKPSYEQALDLLLKVLQQVPHSEVGIATFWGSAVIEALRERGVRVKPLVRRDETVSPPLFYEAVANKRVRHPHLPLLDWQMARVGRKQVGDDFKLVRPSSSVEIDAAMATVYAVYLCLIDNKESTQLF